MGVFVSLTCTVFPRLRLVRLSTVSLGYTLASASLMVYQSTNAYAGRFNTMMADGFVTGYPTPLSCDSRHLLDVRAGVHTTDERWRVQLWGKNVTNQYYWTNVASYYDTIARYAGRPATFGVTASYNFK
jgi:iron complex outermembrane receptor protein